jgi:two-component system, cell cycle sensor histidine kinase and response regulator CckA
MTVSGSDNDAGDEDLERRYRFLSSIIEHLPNMIFVKDAADLRFVRINRAGEQLLGLDRADLIGRSDHDFFPPEEADSFVAKDREVLAAGQLLDIPEEPIHTSHRGTRFLHTKKIPILDDSGTAQFLLGISEDVTERKYAEEGLAAATLALRERDQHLTLLLRNFPGVVWTRSHDGELTTLDGTRVEALDRLIRQREEGIADLEARAWSVGFAEREMHADGLVFDVRVDAMATSQVVGVALDVTERQRLAAEEMRARLQRSQHLETLGVLAGGIAHDFNNLLASMLGSASLALMNLEAGRPVSPVHLERVITAAERAGELTRQMLAYSGRGSTEVCDVNLTALAADTLELLRASVSKKAQITLELDADVPSVTVDEVQIRQLVMNLITNASDALQGKPGTIRMSTDFVVVEALQTSSHGTTIAPGSYVRLLVADSGVGMKKHTLARVFDPFYTTKQGGHGLGLAAALGIVRGHSGAIDVQSRPKNGTTVTVLLPTSRDARLPKPTSKETTSIVTATGRALVVEDESSLRALVCEVLAVMGMTVVEAADGQAGLEAFLADDGEFELVVLDLNMPRMSGPEVFDGIVAAGRRPSILFTSGFGEDTALAALADGYNWDFLPKPYHAAKLAAHVKRLLEHSDHV